jgi:O-antigen/teichoic acid export membrane protein
MAEVRWSVDGEGTPEPASDPGRPPAANASARQLARNVVSSYGNFFLVVVMSLVLTRVLLRHLGTGAYGLWIVLLAIVGYIGLLDVGVSTAAVQRVARLMADHDRDGVADLIRTAWTFFALSGIVAVLVTVALAPFVASFLHLGAIDPSVATTTLIILGLMTAVMFLGSVPNAVLFGSGRGDRLAQLGGLTLICTQATQIVVVVAGGGLVALAVVSTAGVIVALVMTAAMVGRITGSSIRHGRFRRSVLVDLLRFGGRQSVISVGGVVAYQLDAVVIGLILPVAQVAPYDIALSTSNLTRNLSTQGTNLLLPTYAHLDAVGDHARQAWYFFRSVLVGLAISIPIVIALAAFGEPMLKLWLGSVPPKTYEIVIALGLVITVQLPGNQCFSFLTGVGRIQLLVKLSIVGALVNLAGSIAATFWLGPVGPAIGSLPVVVVLDFFVLPVIVCRDLAVTFTSYARTALAPLIPASVVAGIVAVALVNFIPDPRGVTAIVEAIVVVAVSWITMAIVLLRIEPGLRIAAKRFYARRRG